MSSSAPAERTGHSRHLRNVLKAARDEREWSAQHVADLIAADLGRRSLSGQAVRYWEKFERHPPIDVFAGWARVLGYRLMVDLDRLDAERTMVLLQTPEAIEAARILDLADDEKRAAVLRMMEALLG